MNKFNGRNKYGVKSSCYMYRTINGIEFEQYTSDLSQLEQLKKEMPEYKFIKRSGEIFKSVNKIKNN